jgi:hypothetical protein
MGWNDFIKSGSAGAFASEFAGQGSFVGTGNVQIRDKVLTIWPWHAA